MRIIVLFFGQLREIASSAQAAEGAERTAAHAGEHTAELPAHSTVQTAFDHFAQKFPALEKFRSKVAASVNQEYAQWNAPLTDGDEVAFLPPVSGGEHTCFTAGAGADAPSPHPAAAVRLTRDPLRIDAITAAIRAHSDGALVIFDGFVRDNFRGRATTHLEYHAYEPMALAQIQKIAAHMHATYPISRLAIVHRLGRLEVGETSIVIAVTAAHRAAAFDACRYAIDTLKRTVPIWKKEFFADGSVWADGETPRAINSPTANFPSAESHS